MTVDYIYLVLIVIILTLALLEWKHPASSNRFFKAATAVVFFFTIFRAPVICADMWSYTKDAIGKVSMYTYAESIEPLYDVYRTIFRNFCPHIFPFILVTSLITLIPVFVLIKRYSKYKTMSVLFFFLLLRFDVFWGILRQCLALSFMLWAVMYVMDDKKRKWLVYAVLCIIAYFFHHSSAFVAALFLGCYFLPIKNRVFPIATIFVTFVIGMLLQSFDFFSFLRVVDTWGIVEDKYTSHYLDEYSKMNENAGGKISLVTMARPILAMIIFLFINKEKVNHWFSKIFFAGIVLLNLFTTLSLLFRMLIANMLFGVILVSWVLESRTYIVMKTRNIVRLTMTVVICLYTIAYCKYYVWGWDLDDPARLHPYYFIWEDYSSHPAITRY